MRKADIIPENLPEDESRCGDHDIVATSCWFASIHFLWNEPINSSKLAPGRLESQSLKTFSFGKLVVLKTKLASF